MPATQPDWDEKHRAAGEVSSAEAAPFVRELLPLLPGGAALDVACGRGRHTLLLAEKGWAVTAIDWSKAALDILEGTAAAKGLKCQRANREMEVAAGANGILAVCANLESAALPPAAFALILCIQYLDRRLMRRVERALRPGGMLLFETYTTAQLAFDGGPRNPDYLLKPGELRGSFRGLEIIFYRELSAGQGIASLLARKPQKGAGSDL